MKEQTSYPSPLYEVKKRIDFLLGSPPESRLNSNLWSVFLLFSLCLLKLSIPVRLESLQVPLRTISLGLVWLGQSEMRLELDLKPLRVPFNYIL